ncbi:MAG: hypothetical protein AABX54_01630 [Nanoarchaeota archaeon]
MKFNKKNLMDTLWAKSNGKTSYQARKKAGVFVRRVDQIWKEYLTTGNIGNLPEILTIHAYLSLP